jgi:hypothetical protein
MPDYFDRRLFQKGICDEEAGMDVLCENKECFMGFCSLSVSLFGIVRLVFG